MNVLNMLLYSFEDIVVPPKVITDLPTYHNTDNINCYYSDNMYHWIIIYFQLLHITSDQLLSNVMISSSCCNVIIPSILPVNCIYVCMH